MKRNLRTTSCEIGFLFVFPSLEEKNYSCQPFQNNKSWSWCEFVSDLSCCVPNGKPLDTSGCKGEFYARDFWICACSFTVGSSVAGVSLEGDASWKCHTGPRWWCLSHDNSYNCLFWGKKSRPKKRLFAKVRRQSSLEQLIRNVGNIFCDIQCASRWSYLSAQCDLRMTWPGTPFCAEPNWLQKYYIWAVISWAAVEPHCRCRQIAIFTFPKPKARLRGRLDIHAG